ncbi:MAG: DUF4010 domain-containing protein [Deltaproteobacteria bacterium]|nr:MAG: DUF4010 domain-containing protein [Deltaproteobacteria bacterium]
MTADPYGILIELGYAAGIGALIGIERAHSERSAVLHQTSGGNAVDGDANGTADAGEGGGPRAGEGDGGRAGREAVDTPSGQAHAAAAAGAPNPDAAGAVGLGVRAAGDAPVAEVLGARTFSLLAVLGWLAGYASGQFPWVVAAGLVAVAAMMAVRHLREVGQGVTTEVAGVLAYLLGAAVRFDRSTAVAVGLLTTLLLISKPWIHGLMPRVRRVDLTSTLQVLILLAVVIPLLPDLAVDPWGAVVPREIGWFVLLIGGISYVGYFFTRILGERRGAGIMGVVGGLSSSTALTTAMSQQARANPAAIPAGQLATFVANTMMFGRVLAVAAVIAPELARELAPSMVAMGVVTLTGAAWSWRVLGNRTLGSEQTAALAKLKNPFALLPALQWGAIIAVILIAATVAHQALGDRGLFVAAAVAGVADVDAITLAASRHVTAASISSDSAATAVTIAVVANTIFKGSVALAIGRRAFGDRIAAVFAIAIVVGLGIAVAL